MLIINNRISGHNNMQKYKQMPATNKRFAIMRGVCSQ